MYAKFQFRNYWGCGIINKEWASDGFLFYKYRILYFIIKIILLPFEIWESISQPNLFTNEATDSNLLWSDLPLKVEKKKIWYSNRILSSV